MRASRSCASVAMSGTPDGARARRRRAPPPPRPPGAAAGPSSRRRTPCSTRPAGCPASAYAWAAPVEVAHALAQPPGPDRDPGAASGSAGAEQRRAPGPHEVDGGVRPLRAPRRTRRARPATSARLFVAIDRPADVEPHRPPAAPGSAAPPPARRPAFCSTTAREQPDPAEEPRAARPASTSSARLDAASAASRSRADGGRAAQLLQDRRAADEGAAPRRGQAVPPADAHGLVEQPTRGRCRPIVPDMSRPAPVGSGRAARGPARRRARATTAAACGSPARGSSVDGIHQSARACIRSVVSALWKSEGLVVRRRRLGRSSAGRAHLRILGGAQGAEVSDLLGRSPDAGATLRRRLPRRRGGEPVPTRTCASASRRQVDELAPARTTPAPSRRRLNTAVQDRWARAAARGSPSLDNERRRGGDRGQRRDPADRRRPGRTRASAAYVTRRGLARAPARLRRPREPARPRWSPPSRRTAEHLEDTVAELRAAGLRRLAHPHHAAARRW